MDLSEEIPPLLTNECGLLQDLLTSTAAVSEYSVCGVPVGSKAPKNVQTVPRHAYYLERGPLFQTFTSTADIIYI